MKIKFTIIPLFISLAVSVFAARPIDEAKALYREGSYAEAVEKLQSILKRTPKDGTANYYLGACYLALDEPGSAIPALKKAESRGVADASRMLAEVALDEYRASDAEEHLDNWAIALKKSKKSTLEEFSELTSRMVMLKNMLERVEKIEVIDSVSVDSVNFFSHYPLSSAAGRLLPASALPPQYQRDGVRVVYCPQSGREVIWAMPDSTGTFKLVSAGILDDGTMESPSPMEGEPGEGGDADFPFLMPDGMTLYFANNGENSLGGYDIFMTRRSDDGSLLQPQNVGMPYNSPANDFLLAIDETTGLGWWATDRNSEPGKVTIYTFVTAETRINCDPNDDDIANRARLTSIAATRIPGKDYASMLAEAQKAAQSSDSRSASARSFSFSLGNGKVVTEIAQLRNVQARQALQQWLDRRDEFSRTEARIEVLRRSYKDGDRSVGREILSLENRLPALRDNMRRLANQVVRLETGAK